MWWLLSWDNKDKTLNRKREKGENARGNRVYKDKEETYYNATAKFSLENQKIKGGSCRVTTNLNLTFSPKKKKSRVLCMQ